MNFTPYLQFLRYCLDDSYSLPKSAKNLDWTKMMAWAERQTIVGVMFHGIEKAEKRVNIPFDALMQWIGYSQTIESRNRIVNRRCAEICQVLSNDGFKTCILKGQGNALMYPKPLLRIPGDIDLYVTNKSIKQIMRYVQTRNSEARALYHHIDLGNFKETEIEVHYRPTFMFNLVHNYRLQRWFTAHGEGTMVELPEGGGNISVPNWEFNIIFQLSHVYNHLLHEGIGLRQIIDYYYLLKSNTIGIVPGSKIQVSRPAERAEITETLKYLGLDKIAGAMMWVLNEVLGLSEEFLIAPKDEKRGRVLFAEIMKGGNFGHYDAENQKANNVIKKNLQRIKRDMRMMRYFPSECLWEPVFRVYHWIWRLRYN